MIVLFLFELLELRKSVFLGLKKHYPSKKIVLTLSIVLIC